MARTIEREPLLKWAGPISSTQVVLLAKKESNIIIESTSDLSNHLIGSIKDDIGDQTLKHIDENIQIIYPHTVQALLKMLNANRIQLLAYEHNVLNWHLSQNNYDLSDFEQVFLLEESQLYYAFNKNVSDDVVAKFQSAIDQSKTILTDQGISIYDSLIHKYGVNPSL